MFIRQTLHLLQIYPSSIDFNVFTGIQLNTNIRNLCIRKPNLLENCLIRGTMHELMNMHAKRHLLVIVNDKRGCFYAHKNLFSYKSFFWYMYVSYDYHKHVFFHKFQDVLTYFTLPHPVDLLVDCHLQVDDLEDII
ncbi:hypothetical protein KP509_01G087900 [Ceratopteris richardii]|uniref:Uncharacterized protein n=1 Tax=Ceratopteris richardii TaxID=49495 RepID=A0A8T2VMQ6_CERRI|nr:hypothetical protein KP509_01G087900 [Ceratopteris richardii]